MLNKKKEIQRHLDLIFKDFDFKIKPREAINNAHKLLKNYEVNKDIVFYDIEENINYKYIRVNIKFHSGENIFLVIQDDEKE